MQRAQAYLQNQAHQAALSRQEEHAGSRRPRVGRLSAALAAGLLLSGTAFYVAMGRPAPRTAQQPAAEPALTPPPAAPQFHPQSPGAAYPAPFVATAPGQPGPALLSLSPAPDVGETSAEKATLPAEATTLAQAPQAPPEAPTPRRPRRWLRRSASDPQRPS
ncbi:MAG: hypothetical protein AB7N91_18640 [Candidatus Tectimicrobiota bacterium]